MADTTDSPQRPKVDRRRQAEGSIRETLESIVIAFVLAFVFRAFVVEAFVIPTGSMAPTLLGQHARIICPECGYRFSVGPNDSGVQPPICPMCDYRIPMSERTLMRVMHGPDAGDRILVLKYPYEFVDPSRWDVVVFKNPKKPDENYIKRLVGLPGEQLRMVAGNVYTRPLVPDPASGKLVPPPADAPWQIQRKPAFVQRAVWQPIYDSTYYPLDAEERAWRFPWQPMGTTADRWEFSRRGPHYHYESSDGQPGQLVFRFNRRTAREFYAYNMLGQALGEDFVDEMRIGATIMPEAAGARVIMTSSGRNVVFRAVIEPDGTVVLQNAPAPQLGQPIVWSQPVVEGRVQPLPADRASKVEFWHADQALSLWINDELAAYWPYDIDLNDAGNVNPPELPPLAQIEVQGPAMTLRDIELSRDLYYTQMHGRRAFGASRNPATIPLDRFYVLGDNSPSSEDSRLWGSVDEWAAFYTNVDPGLVPRNLMIGRAFFVYFPAPLPLIQAGPNVVPNFGDMRFIH